MTSTSERKSVVVVGGGLAGIAAALRLSQQPLNVTLVEAKGRLGGRAGSFSVPSATGEASAFALDSDIQPSEHVDYCQHVAMRCNHGMQELLDLLGQSEQWQAQETLHFYGPDGRYTRLGELPWLPAPLHIGHWLWKWPGLNWSGRWQAARALTALLWLKLEEPRWDTVSALDWLRSKSQSQLTIENFWSTIIVSALGEECHRVSMAAVGKVFQDGFLKRRSAFHLLVPKDPLRLLFDEGTQQQLHQKGVELRLSTKVNSVSKVGNKFQLRCSAQQTLVADQVVLAVPWHQIGKLRLEGMGEAGTELASALERAAELGCSPITGIHTWWDRPWLDTPHAAIVGRLAQWVFPRPNANKKLDAGFESDAGVENATYYQIVVSASRQLPVASAIQSCLCDDLAAVFPKVARAKLVRFRVVTDPFSVFSYGVGANQKRPESKTAVPGLWLAGDWTRTGWPATMEGAVRSGFRVAAEIKQCLNG